MVLPPELWTEEIKARFDATAKVAVKMLRSLCGHPLAGELWQEHLVQKLRSLGGEEIPGHPSNWMFRTKGEIMILNIYVDDLSLAGRADVRKVFLDSLCKRIKLDAETKLKMALGSLAGITQSIAAQVKQPLLLTCVPMLTKL